MDSDEMLVNHIVEQKPASSETRPNPKIPRLRISKSLGRPCPRSLTPSAIKEALPLLFQVLKFGQSLCFVCKLHILSLNRFHSSLLGCMGLGILTLRDRFFLN